MPVTDQHWNQRTLLIFKEATEIVGGNGEGLLVLTDTNELQQIVIPIEKHTLDWFKSRRRENEKRYRHLPDILLAVLNNERITLEIDIDDIIDGDYQAILTNSKTLEKYPIDIADALILNRLSNGTIPILIDNGLFLRQASAYNGMTSGVSIPINILSDKMLEKALQDSVDRENYEIAAQIQEEIKRRQKFEKGKRKLE